MKAIVDIKNWYVGTWLGQNVLYGIPQNHKNHAWDAGQRVSNTKLARTSAIVNIDLENKKVETEYTIYNLVGEGINYDGYCKLYQDAFRTPPVFNA